MKSKLTEKRRRRKGKREMEKWVESGRGGAQRASEKRERAGRED